jgi:hypothetical protein
MSRADTLIDNLGIVDGVKISSNEFAIPNCPIERKWKIREYLLRSNEIFFRLSIAVKGM